MLTRAYSPDSSVNNLIQLRNAEKTPDSISAAINDSLGVIVLTTRNDLQYLIAYQYPGDPKGSFIGFEITHLSTDLLDYPNKKVNADEFVTQNGIRLGMTSADLAQIKGDSVEINSSNGISTYTYTGAQPDFLTRHASDQYIFECELVNDQVSRIRFGFLPEMPLNEAE